MSIRNAEDEIFARWREVVPSLVKDGVVDEPRFVESSPRLVFVLKEVNDTRDGGGWDLREFLREQWRSQTWLPVSRWVHGIRNLSRDIPWSEVVALSQAESHAALRSICAINVKKSPGGSEAVDAEVHAAARRDRAFLAAQLALYSPAVYVWCGVSPDLVFGSSLSWQTTGRGVRFAEWTERDSVFIQCSHPLARWPQHLTYYSLMDAVRSIVP